MGISNHDQMLEAEMLIHYNRYAQDSGSSIHMVNNKDTAIVRC